MIDTISNSVSATNASVTVPSMPSSEGARPMVSDKSKRHSFPFSGKEFAKMFAAATGVGKTHKAPSTTAVEVVDAKIGFAASTPTLDSESLALAVCDSYTYNEPVTAKSDLDIGVQTESNDIEQLLHRAANSSVSWALVDSRNLDRTIKELDRTEKRLAIRDPHVAELSSQNAALNKENAALRQQLHDLAASGIGALVATIVGDPQMVGLRSQHFRVRGMQRIGYNILTHGDTELVTMAAGTFDALEDEIEVQDALVTRLLKKTAQLDEANDYIMHAKIEQDKELAEVKQQLAECVEEVSAASSKIASLTSQKLKLAQQVSQLQEGYAGFQHAATIEMESFEAENERLEQRITKCAMYETLLRDYEAESQRAVSPPMHPALR